MNDIMMSIHYVNKVFVTTKAIFNPPSGLILLVPVAAMPVFSTAEQAAILLLFLFCADFITGIMASWVEFKAVKPIVPASGKRYLIQSQKMRMSGVKFVCYGLGLLCAYGIEVVFIVRKFNPSLITTEDFTFTTFVAAFFCAIEIYSIFFENVKRMGFDMVAWFLKITGLVKKVKTNITDI